MTKTLRQMHPRVACTYRTVPNEVLAVVGVSPIKLQVEEVARKDGRRTCVVVVSGLEP